MRWTGRSGSNLDRHLSNGRSQMSSGHTLHHQSNGRYRSKRPTRPPSGNDSDQPETVGQAGATVDRFWPTDDSPHRLTARHKPDAQGAAPKVSFTVLRPQVARPGFGQELPRPTVETGRRRSAAGGQHSWPTVRWTGLLGVPRAANLCDKLGWTQNEQPQLLHISLTSMDI